MKKVILIPIIAGSALLITGGIIFGLSLKNSLDANHTITKEFKIEEDVAKFDIDLDTADLEFKAADANEAKVVLEEREKMYHETSLKDGTLKITALDKRAWHEKIFSWGSMKVTIYVPNGEYENLKIKISTGNVIVPDGYTFNNVTSYASTGNLSFKADVKDKLEIKSSTGKIDLSDFKAKNIVATASTGDFRLNNLEVEEKIEIKSSTGDIKLNGVKAHDYQSKSSTGKVVFANTIIANHIEVKTSTGSVKFEDSDADTLKIKTDTGDVKGTLLTSKIFYVKSDTGKTNVPPSTTGGLCEIETDTGDINIQIKQ